MRLFHKQNPPIKKQLQTFEGINRESIKTILGLNLGTKLWTMVDTSRVLGKNFPLVP